MNLNKSFDTYIFNHTCEGETVAQIYEILPSHSLQMLLKALIDTTDDTNIFNSRAEMLHDVTRQFATNVG